MGAAGEEMEAAAAREGSRGGSGKSGVRNCGQWLDQEGRQKEAEIGKGELHQQASGLAGPKAPGSSWRQARAMQMMTGHMEEAGRSAQERR